MTPEKHRILVADDHPIFRNGIRALLEEAGTYEVVGEVDNGRAAVEIVVQNDVDVVIMDIKMPVMNGIQATRRILNVRPGTNILALSMHEEERYILEMLQAGARGYLMKSSGVQELLAAVRSIANGQSYFSPEVSSKLLNKFIRKREGDTVTESLPVRITRREKEVLRLISAEFTNREIAEKLNISQRTVDTHRKNLLRKLAVKNTVGLIKYAIQFGLLDEPE